MVQSVPFKQAFIALGSNLEDPVAHIGQAYLELNAISGITVMKRSSLYQSAPVGRLDQPDYINAVTEINTTLTPQRLLEQLLGIERRHGRIRDANQGLNLPRTLDLDILLYDRLQLTSDELTVPHPRMLERAFVLLPLLEIAPDCEIPGHGRIGQFIDACADQSITRLAATEPR